MIGIHPVHRRLAEIQFIAEKRGGYQALTPAEITELTHCLIVNAELVRRLDELKNLAFVAHCSGDHAWEQEICQRIDEMEARML